MSLRWFLIKTKRDASSLYFWNGIVWIPLFFAVRVAGAYTRSHFSST